MVNRLQFEMPHKLGQSFDKGRRLSTDLNNEERQDGPDERLKALQSRYNLSERKSLEPKTKDLLDRIGATVTPYRPEKSPRVPKFMLPVWRVLRQPIDMADVRRFLAEGEAIKARWKEVNLRLQRLYVVFEEALSGDASMTAANWSKEITSMMSGGGSGIAPCSTMCGIWLTISIVLR